MHYETKTCMILQDPNELKHGLYKVWSFIKIIDKQAIINYHQTIPRHRFPYDMFICNYRKQNSETKDVIRKYIDKCFLLTEAAYLMEYMREKYGVHILLNNIRVPSIDNILVHMCEFNSKQISTLNKEYNRCFGVAYSIDISHPNQN